jgi:hypothetical protein
MEIGKFFCFAMRWKKSRGQGVKHLKNSFEFIQQGVEHRAEHEVEDLNNSFGFIQQGVDKEGNI